jgi:hypothetical protein
VKETTSEAEECILYPFGHGMFITMFTTACLSAPFFPRSGFPSYMFPSVHIVRHFLVDFITSYEQQNRVILSFIAFCLIGANICFSSTLSGICCRPSQAVFKFFGIRAIHWYIVTDVSKVLSPPLNS